MQREDRLGRVPGGELGEREQVREGGPEIGPQAARRRVGRERIVESALVLVEVAEIVVDLGGVRD